MGPDDEAARRQNAGYDRRDVLGPVCTRYHRVAVPNRLGVHCSKCPMTTAAQTASAVPQAEQQLTTPCD